MADNMILDWDSELSADDAKREWKPLPEGDYNYVITEFERGSFKGSAKIPPCNKAIITVKCVGPDGEQTVKTDLIMYQSMEWKLSQFFRSIGQKKHGEKLKPDWGKVVGSVGRCRIKQRVYTNSFGIDVTVNDVDEFYDYNAEYFSGKVPAYVIDAKVTEFKPSEAPKTAEKPKLETISTDEELPF